MEERILYADAQDRSRRGDLAGTIEILRELNSRRPDSPVFCVTLANSLKEAGELAEAEEYFRKAVVLAPESEKVSLGLFHCLWRCGKKEEAMAEIKRFLSLADSADYREILDELSNELGSE